MNFFNQVIKSAVPSPDAKYKITDISLEYEIAAQPTLAKYVLDEHESMDRLEMKLGPCKPLFHSHFNH